MSATSRSARSRSRRAFVELRRHARDVLARLADARPLRLQARQCLLALARVHRQRLEHRDGLTALDRVAVAQRAAQDPLATGADTT